MLKNLFLNSSVSICIAAILTGCGDGNDQSSPSPQPPTPAEKVLSIDGFSVVKPDIKQHISLANYVRGDDVNVASVSTLDPECAEPVINGLGFDVEPTIGTYCDYFYTVNQSDLYNATAHLKVFATSAEQPLLPVLSFSMLLNDEPQYIDIKQLLGSDWHDGDEIVSDSLTIQGMDENLGDASIDGTSIKYTPPELAGWNRILYKIKHRQGGEQSLGSIYITFSDEANKPPTIKVPKYDINSNNDGFSVHTGDEIKIDLSSLKNLGISDPDSDSWQLIDVQSFTSEVSPLDKDSVTNKSFTFKTASVGDHYISYIIADEYNSFASGLLKLHVDSNEKKVDWTSLLDSDNHTFTAPELYSNVKEKGYSVNALWDNKVKNTLAGFNDQASNLYCQSMGVLPTVSNLSALRTSHLKSDSLDSDLAKWPMENSYLASDGNTFKTFNMNTGDIDSYQEGQSYYVTCYENNNMSLTMKSYSIIASGDSVVLATVSKKGKGDINITKMSGSLNLDDVHITKDRKGDLITLTTKSTKAGSFRFKVTDQDDSGNQLASPQVDYIADPNTAKFADKTGFVIIKDNADADGRSVNTLKATLQDAHGNPVKALLLKASFEGDTTAKVTNDPIVTDEIGQATLSISDSKVEKVNVSLKAVLPNGKEIKSQTLTVNFDNIPWGSYPCRDNSFACLPVLPSKKTPDLLYTANPEVSYLNKINYKNFYNSYDEGRGRNFFYTEWTYTQTLAFCNKLKKNKLLNRTDWQPASFNELRSLYKEYHRDLFSAKGWPTNDYYWSSDSYSYNSNYLVDLETGGTSTSLGTLTTDINETSCVSRNR